MYVDTYIYVWKPLTSLLCTGTVSSFDDCGGLKFHHFIIQTGKKEIWDALEFAVFLRQTFSLFKFAPAFTGWGLLFRYEKLRRSYLNPN